MMAPGGLVTGSPFFASHIASYAVMKWPNIVKTLFITPPQSVRFRQAAAALDAMLTPYAHAAQAERESNASLAR